jgi:hypothetical protein
MYMMTETEPVAETQPSPSVELVNTRVEVYQDPMARYAGSIGQAQHPDSGRLIATIIFEGDHKDDELLDLAFRATNSIDRHWVDATDDIEQLEHVLSMTVHGWGHRSTSVGDVVAITRRETAFYVCDPHGWHRSDGPDEELPNRS